MLLQRGTESSNPSSSTSESCANLVPRSNLTDKRRLKLENEEGSHRPQTGQERLVAAGVGDPADDVFAAEFLQIISSVAGTVLQWVLLAECAYPGRHLGSGEAVG